MIARDFRMRAGLARAQERLPQPPAPEASVADPCAHAAPVAGREGDRLRNGVGDRNAGHAWDVRWNPAEA